MPGCLSFPVISRASQQGTRVESVCDSQETLSDKEKESHRGFPLSQLTNGKGIQGCW